MVDGLFNCSVDFRKMVCLDLSVFCAAVLGIDVDHPLPDAKSSGLALKRRACSVIHEWHQKYVVALPKPPTNTRDYRTQLHLMYCYLRDKCQIVFIAPPAADGEVVVQQTRWQNAERELNEREMEISLNLLEVENALQILMPRFGDKYGAAELLHLDPIFEQDNNNGANDDDDNDDDDDDDFEQGDDDIGGNNAPLLEAEGTREAEEEDPRAPEITFPEDFVVNVAVKTHNVVLETQDTEPLLRVCREGLKVLNGIHMSVLNYLLGVFQTNQEVHVVVVVVVFA